MTEISLSELEKEYENSSNLKQREAVDDKYRAYLEEQVKQDPKNVKSLIYLGVICWEPFHEEKKGIEYLERAISYDPKNVEARFWLAKCWYHDLCAYDRAKKLLLEALEIDPSRADCLSLLASVVFDTSQDVSKAIGYLEEAIRLAPEWPLLRFFIAELYLREKKPDLAMVHLKKTHQFINMSPPKPKNFLEDYYEHCVTGRSSKNKLEELEELEARVRKSFSEGDV